MRILAIFYLLLLATPAAATPPQVVAVSEEMLAISPSHNTAGVSITVRTPMTAYQSVENVRTTSTYQFQNADLSRLILNSLNKARQTLPPFYVEGDDVLKDVKFTPDQDCQFINLTERFMQTDGEQQGFWIAHVTCENDITMAPASLFLALLPAP